MNESLVDTLTWLLIACIAIPTLAGLAVLLIQCIEWLSTGTWASASVIDVLSQFVDWPWLYQPTSWIGVWQILNKMPFVLGGILTSIGVFIIGSTILTPFIALLDNQNRNRMHLNDDIPDDLKQALSSMRLHSQFSRRPKSQQKGYLKWIQQAENHQVRAKRIEQVVKEVDFGNIYFGQRIR